MDTSDEWGELMNAHYQPRDTISDRLFFPCLDDIVDYIARNNLKFAFLRYINIYLNIYSPRNRDLREWGDKIERRKRNQNSLF